MPKELFHWLNDNKDKVTQLTSFVKEHVPDELVDDKITYEVKKITPEGGVAFVGGFVGGFKYLSNIIETRHTMNIKAFNEKYNTKTDCLHNLVTGTYIHMYLCVRLLEWLDKERYSAHANIIANFYTSNALINAVIRNMLTPDQVRQVPAILDNNDDVSTSSANNKDLYQVSKNKDIYKAKLDEAHRYILANKHTITMKDIIAEEAHAFYKIKGLFKNDGTLFELRKSDNAVKNTVTNDSHTYTKKQCIVLAMTRPIDMHVYIHIHGGQRPYITTFYNKYRSATINNTYAAVYLFRNIANARNAIVKAKDKCNLDSNVSIYEVHEEAKDRYFNNLVSIFTKINNAYANIGNTEDTIRRYIAE